MGLEAKSTLWLGGWVRFELALEASLRRVSEDSGRRDGSEKSGIPKGSVLQRTLRRRPAEGAKRDGQSRRKPRQPAVTRAKGAGSEKGGISSIKAHQGVKSRHRGVHDVRVFVGELTHSIHGSGGQGSDRVMLDDDWKVRTRQCT